MPTLLQDLPLAFTLPDSNLWEMLAIPLGALVLSLSALAGMLEALVKLTGGEPHGRPGEGGR